MCVIYDPTGGAKTPLMTPPFTLRFSLYDEFGAMVDLVVLGAMVLSMQKHILPTMRTVMIRKREGGPHQAAYL